MRGIAWAVGAAVVVAALGLGAVACSAGSAPSTTSGNTISIIGSDFRFEPATVRVPRGTEIRMAFENRGAVEHDLRVHGLKVKGKETHRAGKGDHGMDEDHDTPMNEIHLHATPKMGDDMTFVVEEAGTFEFDCTVSGHREAGMKGTLIVE